MDMKNIRWGIIGCGNVTEVKSGPAFNLVENSSLVAVMRRDIDKARDYARRHGVKAYYGNADELINDPDVNAVYVATPPGSHAEYAIRAMEAGKPVYVEKPMALNYAECEKMLAVSKRCKMPLYVAYYRRALPGFLKAKELIDAGEIGVVQSFHMELCNHPSEDERSGKPGWRVDPSISGAGHFFDLGSHQLDYLDFLFGPLQVLGSTVKNLAGLYEAEDFVEADFSAEHNITGHGRWDFSGSSKERKDTLEIRGDKGSISFSTFGFVPLILKNEQGSRAFEYPRPDHVQYYLIQDLVAELTGNGSCASTGYAAARTSAVLDQVVKEYYEK